MTTRSFFHLASLVTVLAASAPAQAQGVTALECTGGTGDETVTVAIVNWGTPSAVLYFGSRDADGAGVLEYTTELNGTRARFSNECDNDFELFLLAPVFAPVTPQATSIPARLTYFTDGDESRTRNLSVSCSWNRDFRREF